MAYATSDCPAVIWPVAEQDSLRPPASTKLYYIPVVTEAQMSEQLDKST